MARVINGIKVGTYVPERVLKDYGLDTRTDVKTLVETAKKYDTRNKGYLSENKLGKAADELRDRLRDAPTSTGADGYRYARRALQDVKAEALTGVPGVQHSDQDVIETATRWDDGNKYLSKKELLAGALEIQMSRDGELSAGDVAAIRTWTGAKRRND